MFLAWVQDCVALPWVFSPRPQGLLRGRTNRILKSLYNVSRTSIHKHRSLSWLLVASSGHSGLVSHTSGTFDGYPTRNSSLRMLLQRRGGLKALLPGIMYRPRVLYATRGASFVLILSVGDADNFRLYHTPGLGWRWPLKFRSIPETTKGRPVLHMDERCSY